MKKLALGAALCFAGFLAACGGDDGDSVIPTIDAARIDATGGGVCNPLAAAGMQGCMVGQKCTWITITEGAPPVHDVGKIGCVPDGTANLGEACTHMPAGETTGYDTCKAGSYCINSLCADVCGFDGGAQSACAADFACTQYSDLWANDPDEPMYGVCNPTCNPVTQLRGDGTTCGANKGCYLLSRTTGTDAVCAGAGRLMHGEAIVGDTFVNSCAPGFMPRRANATDMTNECGALCKPTPVFITNIADAAEPPVARTIANGDADPAKVTGAISEGGVAPYTCESKGASAPRNAASGESCRYWWVLEPFDGVTPYSNTVGWCFKHSIFQYDSDGNMTPDRPRPRCAAVSKGDIALPIRAMSQDALDQFCIELPAMLQTSVKNVRKAYGLNETHLDRLNGFR